MNDLHLPLKHEWFVAFKEDDKPVEFREITAHWTKRLMEPTEWWPSEIQWNNLYGKHLDRETLLENIRYGFRKAYIRYKKWGDMVLTDGYPKRDDIERHFRIGWFDTDIGCIRVRRWAWPDTPPDKLFFRIWSNKIKEYSYDYRNIRKGAGTTGANQCKKAGNKYDKNDAGEILR